MNIICKLFKHQWRNDNGHPVHGYRDLPYADSYCARCRRIAGV